MEIKTIGVIGQGIMGSGIVQVAAASGYKVIAYARNPERLAAAMAKVEKNYVKSVEKGRMTQEAADAAKANITSTSDLAGVAGADLVIEVISENMDIKKDMFAKLEEICPAETIFASNTSSTSITEIAFSTKRPEKFIGMHFFNPVPAMKLVEVIRGMATDDDTFNTVYEVTKALGKDPVVVKDSPGFVVNRVLIPMINEAAMILQEGVASAEDIDTAMKLGCNHPMGPLALGDLIGLDTCLSIMDVLYNETGDSKYRAAYLLRKMVRGGMLGRKSGKGFFTYDK